MSKVLTKHRKNSASQDCAICIQVMVNLEKVRPLTPNQSRHYALNLEFIDRVGTPR